MVPPLSFVSWGRCSRRFTTHAFGGSECRRGSGDFGFQSVSGVRDRTFWDRHNDLHSITPSTNSMTTPKDIHPIVMKVLDELSEKYFIHKRPTIKKSDNLELGWGGKGGRKTTINFTFIT